MAFYDFLRTSDGSGDAALAHVQTNRSVAATTLDVDTVTGWPTKFIATTGTLLPSGLIDPVTKRDFRGHLSGSDMIIDGFMPGSVDAGNTTGQVVVLKPNTSWSNDIAGFIRNATGLGTPENATFNDITSTSLTATGVTGTTGTFTNLVVSGAATTQGWTGLGRVPSTVTANGNRNYDLVFNSVDLTPTLSPGMKFQIARTVAAPTKCTSLNGTTNYFNKTSPSGMTFTNNFAVSAWVKLNSYNGVIETIASRFNGTSGWELSFDGSSGQVFLRGYNGGASNIMQIATYASVPLNKWVHIAGQLDMTVTTNTPTTNYIMLDGADIAGAVGRGGSNPTALVQAGNLEIGSRNSGTNLFPGKIAQVAIYSAKVTQATIKASMNQGLTGSETSLISAYSFNNVITDLKGTNNLTAQGSAVATDQDSPFANAVSAGSLEYAEINSVTFSTNTTVNVRVPDTCQIPTSGGISSVNYSTQSNPFGLPYISKVLGTAILCAQATTSSTSSAQANGLSLTINAPAGGARVKITAFLPAIYHSTAISDLTIQIWDGTVGSGTVISGIVARMAVSNMITSCTVEAEVFLSAGSKTYNVGFFDLGGATSVISAAATSPAILKAVLV